MCQIIKVSFAVLVYYQQVWFGLSSPIPSEQCLKEENKEIEMKKKNFFQTEKSMK